MGLQLLLNLIYLDYSWKSHAETQEKNKNPHQYNH